MEKYLYFRTQATIGDDDDIAQSVMHPASSFVGGYPTSDTALTLTFRSMNNIATAGDNEVVVADTVILTTNTNKAKEALQINNQKKLTARDFKLYLVLKFNLNTCLLSRYGIQKVIFSTVYSKCFLRLSPNYSN